MTFPSIEPFSDPAHDLTLDEVQSLVTFRHHKDVLITPAALFDYFQIGGLRLQASQGATVLRQIDFHA